MCMQAIHRYRIASHVPNHDMVSFENLSELCKLNVFDLRRILRLVMTRTVFCEPRVGFVAHTAASRLLKDDPQARDFSGIICDERFPSSAQAVNALQKFGQSQKPNQSGFSLANNTSNGLYEELSKFPARQARWTSAMSAMANRISFDFLMQFLPLDPRITATIVDVAGGSGTVSIGLAPRFPNAKFIVQDTPSTISALKPPPHLLGRMQFQDYDLFTTQHIQGADIYFFRNIFHNWPDKACVEILRNHAPAMRTGSKLVIDDFTLHEPLTLDLWDERRRRNMDVTMMIYFGSRERTLDEWRHLLKEADERYELITVGQAEKEPNTIFVVGWRG
ncbi:S-adenosyl-L-methionine-dependent methyltransferase, partial [Periconia macrospinosa]